MRKRYFLFALLTPLLLAGKTCAASPSTVNSDPWPLAHMENRLPTAVHTIITKEDTDLHWNIDLDASKGRYTLGCYLTVLQNPTITTYDKKGQKKAIKICLNTQFPKKVELEHMMTIMPDRTCHFSGN